ncbi:MAG TPA: GtrA family protein [Acidimicrobiia bacterium]
MATQVGGTKLPVRFGRYTAGSVVALGTSELVLVLCYSSGWLGTTGASVVAFFAGAIPNYVLNRRWVWERRGRPDFRREVVLYAVVSGLSLVAAALATAFAAAIAPGGKTAQVVFVAAAYLATYGGLFVAKFIALHLFVFERGRPAWADSAPSQVLPEG